MTAENERKKIKDHPISVFLLEAVGYEHGILKTIIDLYKNPLKVIESYRSGEKLYVSPVKLLLTMVGVWIAINSFIIDWRKIFLKYIYDMNTLSGVTMRPKDEIFANTIANVGAELLEKYFIPLVIIYLMVLALIATRYCREYKMTLKDHLDILAYTYSINFIGYIGLSILFAINFWIGFGLSLLTGLLSRLGFKNYLNLVQCREFFSVDGKAIQTRYSWAESYATVVIVVITLITLYLVFVLF